MTIKKNTQKSRINICFIHKYPNILNLTLKKPNIYRVRLTLCKKCSISVK